ncbi:hypothetical protein [Euzebya tangerina]|uniref:hypothetical protein n=1 Tax=Euzebya tangerina TaxID=591198 RepID=UPI000E314694|nr:hypothetical protein [Euzebya tangerina]
MTTIIRRGIILSLSILVMLTSVVGVASAQDPECYPVPPGGCEEPTEEPTPEPTAVSCSDIIAAIGSGDTDLDQNGDGAIDAADLPAVCTCAEIEAAVAAGDLDESALPADCVEPQSDSQTNEPEPETLAATGIDSGPLALLALAGLFGGVLLVAVNRKSVKA